MKKMNYPETEPRGILLIKKEDYKLHIITMNFHK